LVTISTIGPAKSSYFSIERYYNDIHLANQSVPKPLLKIDEPFKLRFDITCYRKVYLSVKLDELGDGTFEIIDGPTMKMGPYTGGVVEANETISYEWTLKPTESWAGGSMPLDFVYQLDDWEKRRTISQGEFTAAYVTISNEYYEPPAATKPGAQSSSDTSSPALPAFTLLGALTAMYMVYVLKKK
jgi:sarcinarray family protein